MKFRVECMGESMKAWRKRWGMKGKGGRGQLAACPGRMADSVLSAAGHALCRWAPQVCTETPSCSHCLLLRGSPRVQESFGC